MCSNTVSQNYTASSFETHQRTNRGWFRNLRGGLERKDLALVPINQRIVAVEPGISKHKRNGGGPDE